MLRWMLLAAVLICPAVASAQCVGSTGVPFNCSLGGVPQSGDLVLGGSASNKNTVRWTWDQVFNAFAVGKYLSLGGGNITGSSPGSLVIGSPTGGDKGPGSINATGLFVNGLSVGAGTFLPLAGGTVTGPTTFNDGVIFPRSIYYAQNFGSCTWDATHDVGPCIQLAINAAGANVGGADVVVPNGTYGLSTPLTITTQSTSLRSVGFGMVQRTNVSPNTPVAPTILNWIGSPVTAPSPAINTISIVAPLSPGKILLGTNLQGILFDCKSIAGCSGPLIASVRHAKVETGTKEPSPVVYSSSIVTSGSQAIQVSSTTGISVGQSVVGANISDGSYVALISDSTHFNASTKASGSATETVYIGGEGIRFDVVDNLLDSNDTQYIDVRFSGFALAGAAGATPPLLLIGGSSVTGSGPGPVFHFGNTSVMDFKEIICITKNGLCVAQNNSDHNVFEQISDQQIGGSTASVVNNGSLDPNNAAARYHHFLEVGKMTFAGTDTGGFLFASIGNSISWLQLGNGAQVPVIGTGASVCVSSDTWPAIGCYDTTKGLLAQVPDSTVLGGNNRNGGGFVDLQQSRTAASQVCSGPFCVLTGGENNTSSGLVSVVAGGEGNIASQTGSTIPGGIAGVADLYAVQCYSAGVVASGRVMEVCTQLLRGISAADTTPVRLVADGGTANGINCVGMRVASSMYNMHISVDALDSTDPTNSYAWTQPMSVLTRPSNAASTVLQIVGTPLVAPRGTTTGLVVSETADTDNACYNLTVTPPNSNVDIWHFGATVTWTRTD